MWKRHGGKSVPYLAAATCLCVHAARFSAKGDVAFGILLDRKRTPLFLSQSSMVHLPTFGPTSPRANQWPPSSCLWYVLLEAGVGSQWAIMCGGFLHQLPIPVHDLFLQKDSQAAHLGTFGHWAWEALGCLGRVSLGSSATRDLLQGGAALLVSFGPFHCEGLSSATWRPRRRRIDYPAALP